MQSDPSTSTAGISKLIARVAQADRAAFSSLYQATAPKLLGVVLRILNNRAWAEEVIQDAYLKVWQKAGQFDEDKSSPITWMVSIARNSAIDELRKHPTGRTVNDDQLDQVPGGQTTAQQQVEDQQSVNQLNHCIDQLEKERQDMVRLAYLNGWSRDDLAGQFGQPVNTVKTWLRRALQDIKRCLES
ncbi:sigma-70 family RNA polymerase sigma factor [Marinobacter confluentis]|uniref:Sigma-70 family RNA polymerase sigma factor n=1 Tax=Marinobacter confluentis TaxID=1697557 RepID=A0A4Z1C0X1_9GAMM|nr:sigma-70 family RNA polymerase sigma factor [Marinobacter confluentis]TGN40658.1 sigma-70 family RNA polymerase sigma factor [Marinobacter confluentis]